jgi:hypothetical protein
MRLIRGDTGLFRLLAAADRAAAVPLFVLPDAVAVRSAPFLVATVLLLDFADVDEAFDLTDEVGCFLFDGACSGCA